MAISEYMKEQGFVEASAKVTPGRKLDDYFTGEPVRTCAHDFKNLRVVSACTKGDELLGVHVKCINCDASLDAYVSRPLDDIPHISLLGRI